MRVPTITVDLSKKCDECGKGGATANGLCISCITKAIQQKPMRSATGRAIVARGREIINRRRP